MNKITLKELNKLNDASILEDIRTEINEGVK